MMILINRPRRRGKTKLLVKASNLTRAPIVCPTIASVRYVQTMADELGFDIPKPMTVKEFLDIPVAERRKQDILIDELDSILSQIFHASIIASTRTGIVME